MDIKICRPNIKKSDIFLGCVGYEERSVFFLSENHICENSKILLFDYKAEGLLSYDKNIEIADKCGAERLDDFEEFLELAKQIIQKSSNSNLLIDVTSIDRGKIGGLLELIFENFDRIGQVNFVYCPSKFKPPKKTFDIVNSFGPVLPIFMGNSVYLREKLSLIVGAGYEYGRIIGAIDTLEPERVHCFVPEGTDERFDQAILDANLNFEFLEKKDSITKYDLNETFPLYYDLRRIVEVEVAQRNVMILPLGPKIFATISMIVAMILHPNIMVWRHSTANPERPDSVTDVEASGNIIQFAFQFSPEGLMST